MVVNWWYTPPPRRQAVPGAASPTVRTHWAVSVTSPSRSPSPFPHRRRRPTVPSPRPPASPRVSPGSPELRSTPAATPGTTPNAACRWPGPGRTPRSSCPATSRTCSTLLMRGRACPGVGSSAAGGSVVPSCRPDRAARNTRGRNDRHFEKSHDGGIGALQGPKNKVHIDRLNRG